MSYARFGWGGSNVYVFADARGYLICMSCWLMPEVPSPPAKLPGFHESFTASTTQAMLDHLTQHRQAGHTVPDDCFSELEADAEENDAWIRAKGGR